MRYEKLAGERGRSTKPILMVFEAEAKRQQVFELLKQFFALSSPNSLLFVFCSLPPALHRLIVQLLRPFMHVHLSVY
jgi:hypothetical protein